MHVVRTLLVPSTILPSSSTTRRRKLKAIGWQPRVAPKHSTIVSFLNPLTAVAGRSTIVEICKPRLRYLPRCRLGGGRMDSHSTFHLMIERVSMLAKQNAGQGEDKAFVRWFADLFYNEYHSLIVSDGAGDGKIDASCVTTEVGKANYHIINAKYTRAYNKQAPVQFYEELTALLKPFMSKSDRPAYLRTVRQELRERYEMMLDAFDEGRADLVFVTNCRRNQNRSQILEESPIRLLHLEDLVQFIIDDIDGAMPLTADLILSDVHAVLNADRSE